MLPSLSRGSLPIWTLMLAMLLCGTANAQFTGKRRAYASSFWGGTGASGKTISWSALYVALPLDYGYNAANNTIVNLAGVTAAQSDLRTSSTRSLKWGTQIRITNRHPGHAGYGRSVLTTLQDSGPADRILSDAALGGRAASPYKPLGCWIDVTPGVKQALGSTKPETENLIVDFEVVNDLGSSLDLDSNPNLAFGMAASASDSENTGISAPSAAVDGNGAYHLENYRSAWRSAYHANTSDTVWLNVNLGRAEAARRVVVKWGSFVPPGYTLMGWTPGMSSWVTLATRTGAGGGTHVHSFTSDQTYQYFGLSMSGATRYDVKELEVYRWDY
ncbi:galactose-binding domain-containing protein [Myxococcus sp. NMCA1]|uniref:galactose-binding domain-containing protein n=1 Tax=Myxococcus sp. NMCA1 TaxID=2996785 RepID=UPI0022861C52|nr:discoidin domain-containing protein [Myxococcus sp. NMCA1]WAM23993.1 discoidin domain-containing protein [Myxococcus sp. NMCA1]